MPLTTYLRRTGVPSAAPLFHSAFQRTGNSGAGSLFSGGLLAQAQARLGGATAFNAEPRYPTFVPRLLFNVEQRNKFIKATGVYEPFLNPNALRIHYDNQVRVAGAMQAAVRALRPDVLPDEFSDIVGGNLMAILKSAGFDPTPYIPKNVQEPHGYGKYLLYTDTVAASAYCLQIFAFGAGQRTPVHDHPTNCTSLVVEGTLDEFLYEFGKSGPVVTQQTSRSEGSIGHLRISQSNIHSLSVPPQPPVNAARTRYALSVHLYFIDGVLQPAGVKNRY